LTNPFLNIADLVELNDLVYQILYNTQPNTQTGPLNVYNGITGVVTPTNYDIYFGGSLTQNTTISGVTNTYSLTFDQMLDLEFIAQGVAIQGSVGIYIQTPDQIALTATNGQVLTLMDSTTGEAEWQDASSLIPVNNALNYDLGTLQWGGELVEDTIVLGMENLYDVTFQQIDDFIITSDTYLLETLQDITIHAANAVRIEGDVNMDIITPELALTTTNIVSNSSGSVDITAAGDLNLYGDAGMDIVSTSGDIGISAPTSTVIIDSPQTSIEGTSMMMIKTPNYGTATERNSALTLTDLSVGACEYLPINHFPINSFAVNTSVNNTVRTVLADAAGAGGTITINLPQASVNPYMEVKVKLISAGTLTVTSTGSGATPIFTNALVANVSTAVVGTTYTLQAFNGIWYVL
jgi:hypothetical protein